jgi:DME family drug/metabolite transporter
VSPDRAHLSFVSLAALLWGTTGVVVAVLGDRTGLSPVAIGFHRLAVAAAVLLLWTAASRHRRRRPVGSATPALPALIRPGAQSDRQRSPIARSAQSKGGLLGRLVATGVLLGAYQALYFAAVVWSGVGVATVVSLGLAPVVTTAWEAARARTRPGARIVATVTAALIGLLLITAAPTEGGHAPRPVLGLLAAVGAGLGYAVSALLSRDVARRGGDPLTLTTVTSAIGAAALAPAAFASGAGFAVRADTVALVLFLGVVTTAVAYALFYAGLRTVPGSVAAVLTLLEPLTAALLAVVLLGEPLPGLTVAGGLLLLGAVAGLYVRPTPSPTASAGRPVSAARPAGRRPGRAC